MTEESIVAEFTVLNRHRKMYFIGTSLEDIFENTCDGKEFDLFPIRYERTLSIDEAKELGISSFEDKYNFFNAMDCTSSFYLGEIEEQE